MKNVKNTCKNEKEVRRVLFELSMTEEGALEVYLDYNMKPLTTLAVASALDVAHRELKHMVVWGGDE